MRDSLIHGVPFVPYKEMAASPVTLQIPSEPSEPGNQLEEPWAESLGLGAPQLCHLPAV